MAYNALSETLRLVSVNNRSRSTFYKQYSITLQVIVKIVHSMQRDRSKSKAVFSAERHQFS